MSQTNLSHDAFYDMILKPGLSWANSPHFAQVSTGTARKDLSPCIMYNKIVNPLAFSHALEALARY